MSSLADEVMIPPKKRARHDNEEKNQDRLSDLPDCVILHILSFLNSKHAIQTCILSKRLKPLWKRIPTLILDSSKFPTLKHFSIFVSKIFDRLLASVLKMHRSNKISPYPRGLR